MGAQLSPLTGDEEEDVDYPPDAQSAQGEQLAHRCPRLTQAEPVQACPTNNIVQYTENPYGG